MGASHGFPVLPPVTSILAPDDVDVGLLAQGRAARVESQSIVDGARRTPHAMEDEPHGRTNTGARAHAPGDCPDPCARASPEPSLTLTLTLSCPSLLSGGPEIISWRRRPFPPPRARTKLNRISSWSLLSRHARRAGLSERASYVDSDSAGCRPASEPKSCWLGWIEHATGTDTAAAARLRPGRRRQAEEARRDGDGEGDGGGGWGVMRDKSM